MKIVYLLVFTCFLSVNFLQAQVPNYVPSNGLVGWWPFNGNANDQSGNGNNGTVNGATLTTDRFGNSNSAYYFSSAGCGTRIDVNLNTISIQNGLTFSYWYSQSGSGCIAPRTFEFGNGSLTSGFLQVQNWNNFNSLSYITGNGQGVVLNSSATPLNQWVNVIFTINNSIACLYYNGVLVGSQAINGGNINLQSPMCIGRMNHPAYDAHQGKLDDIGIWNRALTPCEITDLYNASLHTLNVSAGADQSICDGSQVTLIGSGATSYTWDNGVTNNTPFTPTASATYTVTGTDANGCTATDQVVVQVKKIPTVSESTNNICPGGSSVLTTNIESDSTLIEAFTMNFSSPYTHSSPSTITGKLYKIKVSGTWGIANSNIHRDAAYNLNWGGGSVYQTQPISTNCDACWLLNNTFGHRPNPDSYSQLHQYSYDYVGNGQPIQFSFIDNAYGDNAGSLNFQIYEYSEPTYSWSTGATTPSITVNPTATTTYTCAVTVNGQTCSDDVAVQVIPNSTSTISPSVCGTYTAPNGTTYNSSGTYTAVIPNAAGCDSTITINLTVKQPSSSTISPSLCGAYTAPNGTTYNSSGTYTAVIPNAAGCDSTITINLTVKQPSSSTISPSVCGSYTAPNGTTYNSSGTYTAVIPNAAGCDSTITINLTVKQPSSSTISPSVCGTYNAPNGTTYNTSGTYTAVIPNAAGCDSTITINLTVKQPSSSTISPSVCGTYTAPNGTTYNSSGTYTAVIPNAAGCDSTITINLTVKQPSSSTISPSVCGVYTAPNGITYNSSGTYTAVIPNAAGCDSTITINLTVKQPSSSTISPSVCGTYTAPNGTTYNSSGTYTAVIPNAAGCDSTITINLTVTPFTGLSAGADQGVCEGESVTLTATGANNYSWTNGIQNGVAFTPTVGTNVYTVTGTSGAGCTATDHVVVVVHEQVAFNVQVESPTCIAAEDGKITVNTTAGSASFNYLWNTGATTGVLTAVRAGTYSVEVTDFYGCKATQTIVVAESTNACLFISGGLTPNGDGKNDVWIIQGLAAYPQAKLWVFNRWGQAVYEGDANTAPWDGTYQGQELPTADYYYTISLAPDQVDQKGVVTLKR